MPKKQLWELLEPFLRSTSLTDAVRGKNLGIDGNVWLWKAARPYDAELALAYKSEVHGEVSSNEHLQRAHNKIADHLRKWVKQLIDVHGARSVTVVFDGDEMNLSFLKDKTREVRRKKRAESLRRARVCEDVAEANELFYGAFDVTQQLIDSCKKRFVDFSRHGSGAGAPGKAFALQAPDEADPQLAWLFREGIIDVVCTEDCDVIASGVTKVLRQVKMSPAATAELFEFNVDRMGEELLATVNSVRKTTPTWDAERPVLKWPMPPLATRCCGRQRCPHCDSSICLNVFRDLHILMGTDYNGGKIDGIGAGRVCALYQRACRKNHERPGYCSCAMDGDHDKTGCDRALPGPVDILAAAAEMNIQVDRPTRWAQLFLLERRLFVHGAVWDLKPEDLSYRRIADDEAAIASLPKSRTKPLYPIQPCCDDQPPVSDTDEQVVTPPPITSETGAASSSSHGKNNHERFQAQENVTWDRSYPKLDAKDFDKNDRDDELFLRGYGATGVLADFFTLHNPGRYVPERLPKPSGIDGFEELNDKLVDLIGWLYPLMDIPPADPRQFWRWCFFVGKFEECKEAVEEEDDDTAALLYNAYARSTLAAIAIKLKQDQHHRDDEIQKLKETETTKRANPSDDEAAKAGASTKMPKLSASDEL